MIKVIDLDIEDRGFSPSVIGLGNFDGVHLGHRAIMNQVIEVAKEKGIDSSVLLFKQHTNEVFPKMPPYYISSLQDKIDILEQIGIDKVFIIDFTMEFAQLTNEEFMLEFIRDRLNAFTVVCGADYTYGKFAKGTVKELREFEADGKLELHVANEEYFEGQIASSTTVRDLITQGDFEKVTQMLVNPYQIRAKVVDGYKRGSKLLGYPTANLDLSFNYILPKDALYLTEIEVDGVWYPSLTSVGTNPTFTDSQEVKVETYIIDFDRDIYYKDVKLKFLKMTRGQIKFDNAKDLIDQMDYDTKKAREYFKI
ncbi:MAG: riboflavin biosynthesis protein RibF [Tissierellia bacterium]|nr:riboflavin biosynthesis protein RibF [Tissierellia bacterium]